MDNIIEIQPIIAPSELHGKYTLSSLDKEFISQSRHEIANILCGKDERLLVVVGPCSIHDYDTAIAYATSLKTMKETNTNLYIVMRVYFEKPRSRTGWKGFIYDPDMDETNNINKGLELARKLLLEIIHMGIPVGCEFLDLITPQYISELVSWGAIGARTSESQTHRQLTSGLPMPVGFKNLTSGDYDKAINGMISAMCPHNFLSIGNDGRASQVMTKGNPHSHLILRGGDEPNYTEANLEAVTKSLKKEKLNTGIVIDCSHGNSQSDYNRQLIVALYVKRLRILGKYPVRGIMLESNINKGKQAITQQLKYGISVTDACIDVKTTATLLALLNTTIVASGTCLSELRKYIRDYDKLIFSMLNSCAPEKLYNISTETRHIFEKDKEVAEACRSRPFEEELMMMISMRLALSERVAEIKLANAPFQYMNRGNDFLKLVTDRTIEKENLCLFNHQVYLKIMEISKNIQVEYLEKFTKDIKIGYLFGRGTFSHEAISANFRGIHLSYQSYAALNAALAAKEVDFILVPTYNSHIGEILPIESYLPTHGTVDHKIELYLYSNRPCKQGEAKRLYVEPHIRKECEKYIAKHFNGTDTTIVIVGSSVEGCIECMKDADIVSMTISSKHNNSNFLHVIDTNIVDHNITTFSLVGR